MLLALTLVFPDLIGQPQALELLQQAVAQEYITPAYLFAALPPIMGIIKNFTLEQALKQD